MREVTIVIPKDGAYFMRVDGTGTFRAAQSTLNGMVIGDIGFRKQSFREIVKVILWYSSFQTN